MQALLTFSPVKGVLPRQVDATIYQNDKIIIVECKLHNRKIDVKAMGEFYFVIYKDVGAEGGWMVSPLGFTKGAEAIAKAEKIQTAILNLDATEHNYILKVANHIWQSTSSTNALTTLSSTTTATASFPDPLPADK